MISIYKSNRLQQLAKNLVTRLKKTRGNDPFEPDLIIVPNLDTSRWLKLFLAEEIGFAGNIKFQLPGEWQYSCIRDLFQELPKQLPSDPDPLAWAIFDILQNSGELRKFDKLNRFISGQKTEYRENSTIQVAHKLASLYDQYLIYRPEMILRWQSGKTGKGDEKWQAELWNLLDKRWKSIHKNELSINKAELYTNVLKHIEKGSGDIAQSVHLFNPGLIAEPIVKMLKKFGDLHSLDVYLIQPTSRVTPNLHPVLSSWGKESQAIDALFEAPKYRVVNDFVTQTPSNHLQSIQNSIVDGMPDIHLKHGGTKLDGIEIRSCHSEIREVEVLHNFLLQKFEDDDSLNPDDILVVTPDLNKYHSAVHAVFGQPESSLPQIPYYVSGRNLSESDLFERSFLQLLSLADSRFSSSEVMDLFSNKFIREYFELSETEVAKIKQWIDENNVYWGLDKAHRAEFNQPGQQLQTWESAVRRIWLGHWIASSQGENWKGTLLYSGVKSTADQRIWAQFSRFLNLLNKSRIHTKQKRTGTEWCDILQKWMNNFYSEKDLSSAHTINARRVVDTLKENIQLSGMNSEISYSSIRNEIEKKLTDQKSGSAQFNRGVTFSTMVPVRSIPFKIIALIGLNEGTFPRKITSPDYDLLVQQPKVTDRNRRNEDRNLFLESILSATEIHYCSYIGRDIIDNESIPPSPIISDWIDYLAKVSGIKANNLIQEEAISSYSPSSFQNRIHYSALNASCASNVMNGDNNTRGLQLNDELPQTGVPGAISITDFIAFFTNPARSIFRNRFDAHFWDHEEEKNEFQMSHLDRFLLFEKVFGWVLNGENFDRIQSLILSSGILPAGWPGEQEVSDIIEKVEIVIEQIQNQGFEPSSERIEISCRLGETSLEGFVTSYSDKKFLDISFSKKSGKNLIQTWVKHLFVQVSYPEQYSDSFLICEPKKGNPTWIRFSKVENPEDILNRMLELFNEGQSKPHFFFPKTLFEFETVLSAKAISQAGLEKGEHKARNNARMAFEGSDFGNPYPERSDLNVSFLMGDDAEFGPEFLQEEYRELIRQMMAHMEEAE